MKRWAIGLSWIVSIIATLASLYLSEVQDRAPCVLCWYERIALFPLTVLLGIIFFKQDVRLINYFLFLPLAGIALSLYHTFVQLFPRFMPFCTTGICYTEPGHVLSLIPFFALATFILISALMIAAKKPPVS